VQGTSRPATLAVVGRREQLFIRCCAAFALVSPLGLGIGWLQGGDRGQLTAGMSLAAALASLLSLWLTRSGRLALGIDLLTAAIAAVVVGGCLLSGRAAIASFLLFVPLSVATLHREPRRILLDFAVVFASATTLALTLPPIEPILFPSLFVMLLLVGLVAYFSSRVNHLDHQDLLAGNERLHLLNEQLAEATARAEAANDAKTLFLATMSHELRTPLNAVLGYTEMVIDALGDEPLDRAQAAADLRQSRVAAQRLLRHVDRLLDLTRLEVADPPTYASVAVDRELERCADRHRQAAEAAGIDLRVECPEGIDPTVYSNAEELARLLDDLVDNAVRFTPSGEVVLALCDAGDEVVAIEVRDTGVGIEAEKLEQVFQPFTQADGSFTRRIDGVGLGLPSCRRVASRLGATLGLDSTPGVGTVARLVLPRGPAT